MKSFLKNLFDIHSIIGKICTSLCVALAVCAVIGLVIGTTKIAQKNDVVETNYFLNEIVPVHDNNYELIINEVKNYNSITIKDKKGNEKVVEGYFICVNISISQNESSQLKSHKIDKDDFKIKDHTGVYVPLNDIMGAVGWDAIDVHFDDTDGGHVMSSTKFKTTTLYEDYNYIDFHLIPDTEYTFNLYFKTTKFIDVSKELIVLEVDFYYFSNGYRQGTDIILLSRPENLK